MKKLLLMLLLGISSTASYAQSEQIVQRMESLESRVSQLEKQVNEVIQENNQLKRSIHIGPAQQITSDPSGNIEYKLTKIEGNKAKGIVVVYIDIFNKGIDKEYSF